MPKTITTAFYDAMFGQSNDSSELNQLEEKTLNNVRNLLSAPEQLSSHIPPLPLTMLRLIELLNDPHAEFMQIAELIEQDPSLAVEVLRIANTPMYFRGDAEITSLKKAVSLIGVKGIASIASTIMVEKVRPPKPIYYKMFGKQIWIHSLHVAHLCKLMAFESGEDEFSGHFLGLIHDVGKIIVFNCLCDAFQSASMGSQPGGLLFKQMMSEMSCDITTFVAEEWQLPKIYVEALGQQRTGPEAALARLLKEANLLAEIYLLFSKKLIDENQVEGLVAKRKISTDTWQEFLAAAQAIEASVK